MKPLTRQGSGDRCCKTTPQDRFSWNHPSVTRHPSGTQVYTVVVVPLRAHVTTSSPTLRRPFTYDHHVLDTCTPTVTPGGRSWSRPSTPTRCSSTPVRPWDPIWSSVPHEFSRTQVGYPFYRDETKPVCRLFPISVDLLLPLGRPYSWIPVRGDVDKGPVQGTGGTSDPKTETVERSVKEDSRL